MTLMLSELATLKEWLKKINRIQSNGHTAWMGGMFLHQLHVRKANVRNKDVLKSRRDANIIYCDNNGTHGQKFS